MNRLLMFALRQLMLFHFFCKHQGLSHVWTFFFLYITSRHGPACSKERKRTQSRRALGRITSLSLLIRVPMLAQEITANIQLRDPYKRKERDGS